MRTKILLVLVAVLVVASSVGLRPAPALAADPKPKTISVRTVPPLAGVRVELDGVVAVTDAAGTLTFETVDFRGSAERMVVVDREVPLPGGDGYHKFSRSFGKSVNIVLGFDMHREVSFRFETIQGRVLQFDEIDTLQLKNTLGGRYDDVDRSKPLLLHANRVVSSPSGPIIRDIVWSVDSVMVGTSNVVNKSEIRFLPSTETDILIRALFFDADFTVNDLLFGFPTGDTVLVEDPGGVVTEYPLDNGRLVLTDLPRGDYSATVIGPGVKLARPVALSRNQEVDLALLSYLDLAVAGTGLVLFASGTFFLGIRRRRRLKRISPWLISWPRSDATDEDETDEASLGSDAVEPDSERSKVLVGASAVASPSTNGHRASAVDEPRPGQKPAPDAIDQIAPDEPTTGLVGRFRSAVSTYLSDLENATSGLGRVGSNQRDPGYDNDPAIKTGAANGKAASDIGGFGS